MNDKFKLKVIFIEDPMLSADVVEVVVDTNIFMPAMFTILINDNPDPNSGILARTDLDPRFKIGAPISVGFEVPDTVSQMITKSNTLVSGEITSIEPIFSNGKTQLRIRGYDRSHRLMRGRKTTTFVKMTETTIIMKLAAEAGMAATVDSSCVPSTLYDYVLQYNQTNWEFLAERGRLFGYRLQADGFKLNVVAADKSQGIMPVGLVYGENLSRFEPRMVSVGQVTEMTALGWDSSKKAAVTSKYSSSKSPTSIGGPSNGSSVVQTAFGPAADFIIPDKAGISAGEAKVIAKGLFNNNQSQFIKASGELKSGEPNLVAGSMAAVSGVGIQFSGEYYITEARHIWRSGKYTVQFQVCGANPYTVHHLLEANGASSNGSSGSINGVMTAIVTNNKDIDKLGRVKVKFPWMPDANLESFWARVAVPSGGKEREIGRAHV